jgi:hypothetical protein
VISRCRYIVGHPSLIAKRATLIHSLQTSTVVDDSDTMRTIALNLILGGLVFFASATPHISRLFHESVWDDVKNSPLQVQILPSKTPNNIDIIITNKAERGSYYPLSNRDLMSTLQIYNANDEPIPKVHPEDQLSHARIRFQSELKLVRPGESLTYELDVLSEYGLEAGETYYIQVGGELPYHHEGQEQTAAGSPQTHMFEAEILPFTAPSYLPPRRWVQNATTAGAPDITITACSDSQMGQMLTQTVPHAMEQVKKSIAYVQSGANRDTMKNFFKADDANTRKVIIDRLTKMMTALESRTGPARVECLEKKDQYYNYCVNIGAVAITNPTTGAVSICPASKRYPVKFRTCGDSNWGGTLVHELTHSNVVYKPVTTDITYTLAGCKGLSAARALTNANNFNFLADSVMQGKSC